MRTLVSLICVLFSFYGQSLLAQGQWSIGVDYFPNISINVSDESDFYSPKFSNSVGLSVTRKLNDRWWISSGLNYANVGSKVGPRALRWGTQHNGQGGFDPTLPGEEIEYFYNYNHLELPVKAGYIIIKQPVSLYVEGGILLRNYTAATYRSEWTKGDGTVENRRESSRSDFQKLTVGYHLGIGLQWPVFQHFNLFSEPRMQYSSVISKPNGGKYQVDYVSAGLALGVKMDLGK